MYSTKRPSVPGEPVVWYDCPTKTEAKKNHVVDAWCAHSLLFTHVRALEESQAEIHLSNILNAKLYSNRDLMSFEWSGAGSVSFRPLRANVENIIQSVVDTLRARFATNRPRAKVVTRGALFDTYRRGRLLDKFLWGEFVAQDVWAKVEVMAKDAMVYGTGFVKCDIDGDEPFYERVHPDEIVVDQRECVSGEKPLCLVQRKLVSRLWLRSRFRNDPEALKAIDEAQSRGWQYTSYRSPTEDQVVLIEAWKRPTRKGAGDGRHVIAIENYTFVDEPYKRDSFPFVWLKWREPESGFYGLPLVSDLMGYQIKQDDMNDLLAKGQDLMCVPRILAEEGSEINLHQLDNQVAKVLTYRGTKPEALTWNAFNPEMYAERERNKSNAYKDSGVSEAVAQSTALSGQQRFDSAPAQREHLAMVDTRFNHVVQRLERVYLDLGNQMVALCAELYKSDKPHKTTYLSSNVIEQIDWSEVDMDRDRFVLQVAATSVLNMTPAARKDQLEAWLNEGKINIEQYYAMSGEPDMERLTERLAAKSERAEYVVDKMLRGTPQTPTAFDWESSLPVVQDELLRLLSMDDVPDGVVDSFIDWLELAKELAAPAVTEPSMAPGVADAQAAMGGIPPGGMPMDPSMAPTDPGLGMTAAAVDPATAMQFGGMPVG